MNGPASEGEKAELHRIFTEGYAAHLSVGTVHVYLLKPDGHLLDSMHVAQAARTENLIPMLEKAVHTLNVAPGEPIKAAAVPKPVPAPGAKMLHLIARYLRKQGDALVTINSSSGWDALPSEDWITLTREDQIKMLPAHAVIGSSWEPDRNTAVRLLQHFYPPTENWESSRNAMESMTFRGRVTSLRAGIARARLEAEYKMKHAFYHKDDNNRASGSVVGWMEFDAGSGRIRTLHLVTEHAEYGDGHTQPYGVAVLSE